MDFVGLSTRITGTVADTRGGIVSVATPYGTLKARSDGARGARVLLGVRPELISVGEGENTLPVKLADVMVLGSKTVLHGVAQEDDRILCELSGIRSGMARGQDITLGWAVEDTLAYEVPA